MRQRILILDDDTRFRAIMVTALQDMNIDIVQADNISNATAELKFGQFDLLIVDGQLTDGHGLNWLRTLRENNIRVPAVFVSAFMRDTTSFRELIRDLDVCLVLQKPISMGVFAEEIGRILGCKSSASIADILTGLSQDYSRELPDMLSNLESIMSQAQNSFDSMLVLLEAAAQEAHKLRGTAGTFGLNNVGECVGHIEDSMTKLVANCLVSAGPQFWQESNCRMSTAFNLLPKDSSIGAIVPYNQQSSTVTKSSRRYRIVILDDDRIFTRRAEAVLSAEGIMVYSFTDAECITEIMEQLRPDIVLISMDMKMSNPEKISQLMRSHKLGKTISIVFTSASIENELAASRTADGFMSKSIANTKMTSLLESFINSRNRTAAPIQQSTGQSNVIHFIQEQSALGTTLTA